MLPEVLRNLFRKPATVKYPYERVEPPEGLRGKPVIDRERCDGCGFCADVCPARALTLVEETKKPRIQLARCIFCGECVGICPRKAIRFTKEYELATYDKREAVSE